MARKIVPQILMNQDALGPAMQALSPPQQAFVYGLVFAGLSQSASAEMAGYSNSNPNVLGAHSSRLVNEPRIQDAIEECTRQLMRTEGPACVRELIRIRNGGETDAVRLAATKDLLDRMGGLGAITQHNVDVTHTHFNMTNEQKDARILQLAAELGLDQTSAQKLLIDPKNIIEADYEEVKPEKTPEQIARNERQRELRNMTPEQKAERKARVRAERSAKAKAKYAGQQTDIEDVTNAPDEPIGSSDGIEDLL